MSIRPTSMRRALTTALIAGAAAISVVGVAGAAGSRPEQAVLTQPDVPTGYRAQPTLKPGPPVGKVCADVRAALKRQKKVPNAATFFKKSANGGTIVDLVSILSTDSAATEVVDAYSTPEAGDCLKRQLELLFAPAEKTDKTLDVTIDLQSATPGLGDQSTGWRATVSLANKDGVLTSVLDLTIVRLGNAVARFDFGGTEHQRPGSAANGPARHRSPESQRMSRAVILTVAPGAVVTTAALVALGTRAQLPGS